MPEDHDTTSTTGAQELTASSRSPSSGFRLPFQSPTSPYPRMSKEQKTKVALEAISYLQNRPDSSVSQNQWWLNNHLNETDESGRYTRTFCPIATYEERMFIKHIEGLLTPAPPVLYSYHVGVPDIDPLERGDPSWTEGIDVEGKSSRACLSLLTELSPYSGPCVHKGSIVNPTGTRSIRLPTCIAQAASRDIYNRFKDEVWSQAPPYECWMKECVPKRYEEVLRGEHTCESLQQYADISGERTREPIPWRINEDGFQKATLIHPNARDPQNHTRLPELKLEFMGPTAKEYNEILRCQENWAPSKFNVNSEGGISHFLNSLGLTSPAPTGRVVKIEDSERDAV